MYLDLNHEQREHLELISIHTGKPRNQILIDAAQFLLNCDADYYPPSRPTPTQQFLPEQELEARFHRILQH
jgi:hypothetical protein